MVLPRLALLIYFVWLRFNALNREMIPQVRNQFSTEICYDVALNTLKLSRSASLEVESFGSLEITVRLSTTERTRILVLLFTF